MYRIKNEKSGEIKKKFKLSYIGEETGLSLTYISLIFKGKTTCPKRTAYIITKVLDSEAEIDEYFNREA